MVIISKKNDQKYHKNYKNDMVKPVFHLAALFALSDVFLGEKYRAVIAEKVGSCLTLFARKMSADKIDQSASC